MLFLEVTKKAFHVHGLSQKVIALPHYNIKYQVPPSAIPEANRFILKTYLGVVYNVSLTIMLTKQLKTCFSVLLM